MEVTQQIPWAAAPPLSEATGAATGTTLLVPRADHQHPRLTSATSGTTAGDGRATVNFTRTFSAQPIVMTQAVEAIDNGPVTFKVESFLDDTGAAWTSGKPYGGAIIYGYRHRALPTLNLGGIVLIGPLITALGILSAYSPFIAAGNVGFACIAVQAS